jgi:hypothetical protein
MEPSIVGQGLITIGDLGGEHCHLAVLPGGETVYDVDEEEDYEGRLPERWYTSVYHCIVYASREQAVLFQR